jgi:excinuclease ABC subunit A
MDQYDENLPQTINIYHAHTQNLKDVTVHIPLRKQVAIAGVSGSGKSSLAMGVLYAEGSRRYLESLSAFARRKMHQMERADVEKIDFLPPARTCVATATAFTWPTQHRWNRDGNLQFASADVLASWHTLLPEWTFCRTNS